MNFLNDVSHVLMNKQKRTALFAKPTDKQKQTALFRKSTETNRNQQLSLHHQQKQRASFIQNP